HCDGRVVPSAGDGILIAACADGAGSAEHSDIGARLSVETFLSLAESQLRDATGELPPGPDLVEGWAKAARQAVFAEAGARGIKARQMACTLLAAIAGPSWAVFLQIGDGVIV